jgi:DNA-binding winged helix-turn-helix (wHTH) protein
VHLSPKAFELLATLVAERPKVLSKGLLQERLWPRTFVASANLSNLIAEIRGALGEVPRAGALHTSTEDYLFSATRFVAMDVRAAVKASLLQA